MDRIAEIASSQWGLITRRQVERARVPATTIDRLTAPEGRLTRIAFGVYQLRGAPIPDHSDLRAAWLQLAPEILVWERSAVQGVVSHRSAASLFGVGHLPADVHEFTVASRRQTRRSDVRIHVRGLTDDEVVVVGGLPVTRPARIVGDLIRQREDPEAVAQIVIDALRGVFDYPGAFVQALAP
jgi:predicted transcriptional regulator of viral defense system